MERRHYQSKEFRMSGDGKKISGYAATFDRETALPGFTEVIRHGAFDRALREKQDVVCLFNHDTNFVLGRTGAGTLRLSQDSRGLYFVCDLPDTQAARDLHESVKRGDINGCSFAFTLPHEGGQTWSEQRGGVLRELTDLDIHDVSPVTYPAYEGTSVDARVAATVAEMRSRTHRTSVLTPTWKMGPGDWFAIREARRMGREEGRRIAEMDQVRRRRNIILGL